MYHITVSYSIYAKLNRIWRDSVNCYLCLLYSIPLPLRTVRPYRRFSACIGMRSLPFTFFLSCGRGLVLRGIRFLLGEYILGGEAKSVPPPPEPSKPLFKVLFLAATGVLVRQSSGMRYAKSSVPTACRFGAVHVKVLGTAPIAKSVKVETASIVRAHQNLRGDHTQASVLVYSANVRNRDGGWGAGGRSVVEPFRPGQSR